MGTLNKEVSSCLLKFYPIRCAIFSLRVVVVPNERKLIGLFCFLGSFLLIFWEKMQKLLFLQRDDRQISITVFIFLITSEASQFSCNKTKH